MKILCLILCIFVFCSCAKSDVLLELPIDCQTEFDDGELKVDGRLFYDGEKMMFQPETPSGYCITVTQDGGQIEYEGIVFKENVLPSSRFLPLFDMLKENLSKDATHLKFSPSLTKDNIKLTFYKDNQ